MNRFLLSIPVLFAASITAAACSSSSSPNGGTGVDGGGGTPNPDCATLAACCATFTGMQETQCTGVVAAGGAGCTKNLQAAQTAGACKGGTTGHDAGTGIPDTGVTHPHDTGVTPPNDTGMQNVDTGTPATCTPTLAAGWAPETITIPAATACTATTATALADDCFNATDASNQTACNTDVSATCGSCFISLTSSTTWGTILLVPEGSGSTGFEVEYPFIFPANCIAQLDPSGGAACNTAFSNLVQCELASCESNCPVASNTDTAGQDAFIGAFDPTSGALTAPGCVENADSATCMTYAMAFQTACGTDEGDGSAGTVFGQCEGAGVSITDIIEGECGGS